MLYRLVRPMKRKGSSNQHFVQRIPADLRERMVGMKLAVPVGDEFVPVTVSEKTQSIRFSLRSRDPSEVKERQACASAYLEQVFRSLRDETPVALTHRQAVALSGEIYRGWAGDLEDSQRISMVHTDEGWVRDDGFDRELLDGEYGAGITYLDRLAASDDVNDLEAPFGPIVDRLLLARGIASIDAPSRQMVLQEFLVALRDGLEVRKRKVGGDYSPDPKSERFPEWTAPAQKPAGDKLSLAGLLDSWWREAEAAGLSESTHESYRKAISALVDFLDHDNAARVTPDNVIAFKDHLLATTLAKNGKRISAKTVKDSYLSGLKSVFNWAVSNRKLASNPAAGITIKVGKKARVRESWFREDEVKAILSAADKVEKAKKEPWQRHAMKRWVPWLCAYTGARLGEMVQLRKQDLRKEGEHWVITITPEAGRVKNNKRRDVPLHPHIVEMGFPEFVKAAPEGHLFMWTGTDRPAWRTAKNRLTDFVRTVITDPDVQPSHGWRHTFKTIGSEAGIQDKVLDAICGHDPRTVGESYGGVTVAAMVRALESFPRFASE